MYLILWLPSSISEFPFDMFYGFWFLLRFSFFYLLRQSKHTYFEACASELVFWGPVDTWLFLLTIFHLILCPHVSVPFWWRVGLCIWKAVCQDILKVRIDVTVLWDRSVHSSPGASGLCRPEGPQPGPRNWDDSQTSWGPASSSFDSYRGRFNLALGPWEVLDTACPHSPRRHSPESQLPPGDLVSTPDVLQRKAWNWGLPALCHYSPHPCPQAL